MKTRRLLALGLVLGVGAAVTAEATPKLMRSFGSKYPDAKAKLGACATCHTADVPALNSYGADLKKAEFDFAKVEPLDSDGDGAKNLAEIAALTAPGDAKSKPEAKGKAAPDSGKAAPDTVKAGAKK